jgi:hypothetical protein
MEMTASPDGRGYFFCIRSCWLPQVHPFPTLEWALFSARRHPESLPRRHAVAKRKAFGVRRFGYWLLAIRGARFSQKIGHILFIDCGSGKSLMPGSLFARRDENKRAVAAD